MEELITKTIEVSTTTGILLLFVWFVGRQFTLSFDSFSKHLDKLTEMIADCIKGKQEAEIKLEEQLQVDLVNFEKRITARLERAISIMQKQIDASKK